MAGPTKLLIQTNARPYYAKFEINAGGRLIEKYGKYE